VGGGVCGGGFFGLGGGCVIRWLDEPEKELLEKLCRIRRGLMQKPRVKDQTQGKGMLSVSSPEGEVSEKKKKI